MKSVEFFKTSLAITLAIVLVWLVSPRPAQAGYTVQLTQTTLGVTASGSGAIDLSGLSIVGHNIPTETDIEPANGGIFTGLSAFTDIYKGTISGPTSFGSGSATFTQSGSGDMVGIYAIQGNALVIPTGYASGTDLFGSALYSGKTLATLGVKPGTYVWTWGPGANQSFTLFVVNPPVRRSISTRASVQTGPGVTIAGFVITGTGPKSVLVRGLGPTLTAAGVAGVLSDPFLNLLDGGGHLLRNNDNWKNSQQAAIEATGFTPPNDTESAVATILQPGNYTAVLSGKNRTTGVGLVEVYDTTTDIFPTTAVTNISTRGFVGTGENVLIAGFSGSGGNLSPTDVLIRGLGPTLAQFGVSGALANPVVTLVDSNGNVVRTNNNWKDTQRAEISATGKAPPNDREAAILATVSPGNYTAILSGNRGGTGVGLVEVYKLPRDF